MATENPPPAVQITGPAASATSIDGKPTSISYSGDSAIDDIDDNMEYDSDPDHSQDWSKTTDPKDSWAVKERLKQSKYNKGPTIPNPHAPNTGKDRRGSVLSLFKTGKNQGGEDVLHSGFEDHPENWEAEKQVKSRTMSNDSANERRGSILSIFKHTTDNKGRNVINSGDWDHPKEPVVDVQAVEDSRRLAELKAEVARLEARVGASGAPTS